MESWTVLHLSDFHLGQAPDPGLSGKNPLRKDYFKHYLRTLTASIGDRKSEVQAIIATGDFVDKHKASEFSQAIDVIRFVAAELGLSEKNVAVCPGNHDFDQNVDRAGDPIGARARYRKFLRTFANGRASDRCGERGLLFPLGEHMWCLSLDSTWGCGGMNAPGDLADEEIDEIHGVVECVPKRDLLIVASHNPIYIPSDWKDASDTKWIEKRVWMKRAFDCRYRIESLRGRAPTLWLSGDAHVPDFRIMNGLHHVITARFGTAALNDATRRQARVISVATDPRNSTVETHSWEMPETSHFDEPDRGTWVKNKRGFPGAVEASSNGARSPLETIAATSREVECLNENLEEQILSSISSSGLYHVGRFQTTKDIVQLSWVSIGPLLNHGGIFALTVDRMFEFLERKKLLVHPEKTLIVGVDCWGAILASQLSVVTGLRNLCVAARTRGARYTETEQLTKQASVKIATYDTIILVTDVIATGSTLHFVYERVSARRRRRNPIRWIALSLICDPTQDWSRGHPFLSENGTACSRLRMPLLSEESLPEASILPSKISLI